MKFAAAIRHVPFEDAGALARILEHDYSLRYFEAGLDDLRARELRETELLIVLGGPIGAYEEDKYPFLTDELALIEGRIRTGQPLLGICLGAQLLARALGSRVYPGPSKEIGWAPITLTDAGRTSATRHLEGGPVLHWHGDTFDLPAGTELLASTSICRNQAFALGAKAIGFQFHPEADGRNFEQWLIGHAAEISGVQGLSVNALRADTKRFAPDAADRGTKCLTEWLRGIAATPS